MSDYEPMIIGKNRNGGGGGGGQRPTTLKTNAQINQAKKQGNLQTVKKNGGGNAKFSNTAAGAYNADMDDCPAPPKAVNKNHYLELRRRREALGMSQDALANKVAGARVQDVRQFENGSYVQQKTDRSTLAEKIKVVLNNEEKSKAAAEKRRLAEEKKTKAAEDKAAKEKEKEKEKQAEAEAKEAEAEEKKAEAERKEAEADEEETGAEAEEKEVETEEKGVEAEEKGVEAEE